MIAASAFLLKSVVHGSPRMIPFFAYGSHRDPVGLRIHFALLVDFDHCV